MRTRLVDDIARFATRAVPSELPDCVVLESKRLLLDAIGCALAAVKEPKGRMGIAYGLAMGGAANEASILGTTGTSTVFGAAAANGELVNTLDYDAVLPPGHVSPYVVPPVLAVAEHRGSSGSELLAAIAIAHEVSYRFGKAMDPSRQIESDGTVTIAPVLGYSASVFGATAGVSALFGFSSEVAANALGIAATNAPVNSHRAWMLHAPSPTVKSATAASLVQTSLMAAYMANLGHTGDRQSLDDGDFGYRRYIGTGRWEPDALIDELGEEWRFPAESTFKPYPHCRVLHGPLEALRGIVAEHGIRPEEISAIRAWGEAWLDQPVWMLRSIHHVQDAQFSIPHGLALGAHLIPPGAEWQDPKWVFSESVIDLMDKVTFAPHPNYGEHVRRIPASRPSRVEVDARGRTFAADVLFPKGSPSPDPASFMSDEELADKFIGNATRVLPTGSARKLCDEVMTIERSADIRELIRHATSVRSEDVSLKPGE